MRIVAFYLPQFHTFPENDAWWGKGFTEWTNTRKARPLYRGHYEPREPLGDNYYCLLDRKTLHWQVALAKKYGIYGFCFYQYWFGADKILMNKPIELYLSDASLDLPFCISWANESFTRRWDGKDQEVLMKQEYGDEEEWRKHFAYLLPFFQDPRYMRWDGKPLFILYKPEIFPQYREMFALWNALAEENGLGGLTFAVQSADWNAQEGVDDSAVDYRIMYEPGYTACQPIRKKGLVFGLASRMLRLYTRLKRNFHVQLLGYWSYCRNIVKRNVESDKFIPGFFVDWDNTPRKGDNGSSFLGSSPRVFGRYLSRLIKKTREEYHKDYIFLNAWNEWAEGCFLEPDKRYRYGYLRAVRSALQENGEFPCLPR